MLLPYHKPLTDLARTLRERQTITENILWQKLRNRKFLGYRFLRQKPILSYVADFYCYELSLVIELDGEVHLLQQDYDAHRTKELQSIGLTVVRYRNDQILEQLPRVLKHLERVIQCLKKPPQ
jgi:very-short-patch-repair endonuclease